ncbi:DsbA family protein [Terriglobus saanensis]|uniref:Putative lipoprotein n=1 Tax=Terriglobus saanensis (strain ATCC BAA-1853 / DSM 23119 / SP1PR4) TaxID=401053 RepID=E8V3Q3_TERSS|nr:thioredoxin domain-containing protein [Terriglobus saanensis]ADV84740.1 putative lipoprotein [Terriglobus saanensis SP1PR4]
MQKRFQPLLRRVSVAVLALAATSSIATLGCHAQSPRPLTPETARRIVILIRQKASVPFNVDVQVVDRKTSTFPGYDEVTVNFLSQGQPSHPLKFLLSQDNKTIAQFNTFDISKDPSTLIAEDGRPARGGPPSAPVHIVVFDDLECPFCQKMHAQLFPAILARYKDQVRIIYKDFPLSQHPWAIHAAVDAACLGTQNAPAYWDYVDGVHARLAEIGHDTNANTDKSAPDTAEKALARADTDLDHLGMDIAKAHKVDDKSFNACMLKQDTTAVTASLKEAEAIGVDGAPALFINGFRISGAIPIEYVWKAIDEALVAQGKTPPPAVPLPQAPSGQ